MPNSRPKCDRASPLLPEKLLQIGKAPELGIASFRPFRPTGALFRRALCSREKLSPGGLHCWPPFLPAAVGGYFLFHLRAFFGGPHVDPAPVSHSHALARHVCMTCAHFARTECFAFCRKSGPVLRCAPQRPHFPAACFAPLFFFGSVFMCRFLSFIGIKGPSGPYSFSFNSFCNNTIFLGR